MFTIKRKKLKKPIDQHPMDENGKLHGEWIGYYSNGKIDYRWNWFHGIRHRLCEGYYSDGLLHYFCRLHYRGYFNMGKQIGYWYYSYQPKRYFLWLI